MYNKLPIFGATCFHFHIGSLASPVATPDISSTMPPGRSTRHSSAVKRWTELGPPGEPWGHQVAHGMAMDQWNFQEPK